ALAGEICLEQLDAIADRVDVRVLGRPGPHDSGDRVAALEQKLGKIRAVLPADPGDERPFHDSIVPAASAYAARVASVTCSQEKWVRARSRPAAPSRRRNSGSARSRSSAERSAAGS